MDKDISKVVKNSQDNYSDDAGACLRKLGSEMELSRAADLYLHHGDLLHLVSVMQIVDFCENTSFSKEEYDAFKLGALSVGLFLQKSYQEIVAKNQKESLTNKKASLI